jgi:hypothetical protein
MRACVLLLVLATASVASADVDIAIANGVKIAGTFDPGSETETFRFVAPAGAELTVTVKGRKAKGSAAVPAPRLRLYDPAQAEIAADEVVTSSSGATLTGYVLRDSGEHRVVVRSDGGLAGDYQLQVSWKVEKRRAYQEAAAAVPAEFTISLQEGAVATLTASTAADSQARPWVSRIEGGGFAQDFPQPPVATRHKVTTTEVTFTGEYTVFVTDQSGQGGGVVDLAVSVKAPKPLKKSIQLGNKDLANAGALGGLARGALIDADGGRIDIGDGGTPIDGTSVTVPAQALPNPTPIVIGTGSPIPETHEQSGAGPTILLGPEGTRFKEEITVTIPFDPALLAGGDVEDLAILTRDKKGEVSVVPGPYTVDTANGTITFTTSHFSDYRAFGPKRVRPADLDGDGIDDLVIPAPADASGRGAVFVFRGRKDVLTLDGKTTADADFVFTGVNARVGTTPGDLFGTAAATGDVNGDGVADLVVGASRADGERGAVYVFFGGPGFASRSSADADAVLSAVTDVGLMGTTVLLADATGDGVADVLVGAPGTQFSQFETEAGAVFVFAGGPAFASASTDDAAARVRASQYGAALGTALAIGDVTGDGVPDLAIGSDELQREGDGSVYVFPDASSVTDEIVPGGGFRITSSTSLAQFGDALAIGDVNGDGLSDLVAGMPGFSPTAPFAPYRGRVFFFYGNASFGSGSTASANVALDLPLVTPSSGSGATLVLANLIGDGAPDLLVGAPGRDSGTLTANGAAYLTRGGPTFTTAYETSAGTANSDGFGVVLTPADVNGDGYLDAILASPDANGGAGYVRVHLGPGLGPARFEIAGAGVERFGVRDVGFDPPSKR